MGRRLACAAAGSLPAAGAGPCGPRGAASASSAHHQNLPPSVPPSHIPPHLDPSPACRSGRVLKALYNHEAVAAKIINISKSAELEEAFLTEACRLSRLRREPGPGGLGA